MIGVHWRYGLRTRGIAFRSFPPEASTGSSPPQPLRLLRASPTVARWDCPPLRTHDYHGAPSPVASAPGVVSFPGTPGADATGLAVPLEVITAGPKCGALRSAKPSRDLGASRSWVARSSPAI